MTNEPVNAQVISADQFCGNWNKIGFLIGLTTTLYFMYVGAFGTFSPALDRSLFIFVGVALAICYFPLANSLPARLFDVVFFDSVTFLTSIGLLS